MQDNRDGGVKAWKSFPVPHSGFWAGTGRFIRQNGTAFFCSAADLPEIPYFLSSFFRRGSLGIIY